MWDTIIAWLTLFLMVYGAISLLSGITLFAIIFVGEWRKERRSRNAYIIEDNVLWGSITRSWMDNGEGVVGEETGKEVV